MFKVKLTILLINFLVVSTICDDSIIEPVEKENNKNVTVCEEPREVPDYILTQLDFIDFMVGCIDQGINLTNFRLEIQEARTEANVNGIIKNACRKMDIVYYSMENNYEPIDECATVEESNQRDFLFLQSRNLLGHLCLPNGLRLRNFFNNNGLNCVIDKAEILRNCTRDISVKLRSNETHEAKCDYLRSTRVCNVEALQSCENQGAAIFFDELLRLVFDSHICYYVL